MNKIVLALTLVTAFIDIALALAVDGYRTIAKKGR